MLQTLKRQLYDVQVAKTGLDRQAKKKKENPIPKKKENPIPKRKKTKRMTAMKANRLQREWQTFADFVFIWPTTDDQQSIPMQEHVTIPKGKSTLKRQRFDVEVGRTVVEHQIKKRRLNPDQKKKKPRAITTLHAKRLQRQWNSFVDFVFVLPSALDTATQTSQTTVDQTIVHKKEEEEKASQQVTVANVDADSVTGNTLRAKRLQRQWNSFVDFVFVLPSALDTTTQTSQTTVDQTIVHKKEEKKKASQKVTVANVDADSITDDTCASSTKYCLKRQGCYMDLQDVFGDSDEDEFDVEDAFASLNVDEN
ncbi:hypothetical protein BC941DRAFT_472983 [Chlamydoabsidia padenii]|nr:hypothetical protein BC941DRAFT_472983 [Chlamydoabsidia padenii]